MNIGTLNASRHRPNEEGRVWACSAEYDVWIFQTRLTLEHAWNPASWINHLPGASCL